MGHGHDHPHHHHHEDEHGHDHHHHGEISLPPSGKLVRFLYVDPVAGISGDMFLGALVDAGADFERLRQELDKLGIPGFDLKRSDVRRHSIAGTKVDVVVEDVEHPHRHVGDLQWLIKRAPLSDFVKENSVGILDRLGNAEAEAHRMPVEKVHLHEVGGLDCLVDVVGACIAVELLDVSMVVSGPVSLGTGVVGCEHGRMPVPAPGTLGILKDFPVRKTTIEGEMTTPTGAAIITGLAKATTEPLVMIPRRIGYGAGTKDRKEIANLLRVVVADGEEHRLRRIAAP